MSGGGSLASEDGIYIYIYIDGMGTCIAVSLDSGRRLLNNLRIYYYREIVERVRILLIAHDESIILGQISRDDTTCSRSPRVPWTCTGNPILAVYDSCCH